MEKYVFDASVILAFLLGKNEKIAKKIKTLFEKVEKKEVEIYSLYLLPFEVGNGLRFTLFREDLALEVFKKFLNLPINYFQFDKIHYEKILSFSFGLQTTFYDTSYHFLTKILGGKFITLDKKYYKKAKNLGNIFLLNGD